MGGVAQQFRAGGAQRGHPRGNLQGAVLAVLAAVHRGLEEPAARFAVLQRGQQRLGGRQHQGQQVPGFVPGLACGIGGRGQFALAEPGKFRGVLEVDGGVVHGAEQLAGVLGGQVGDPPVQLAQGCLLVRVEFRAGGTEGAQRFGHQARVLALKPRGVEGRQPVEEFLVQVDRVHVAGEEGLERRVDLAQVVGAVGGEDRPVRHDGPAQQLSAAFQGDEGVLERRCVRIPRDGPKLFQMPSHAGFCRLQVVRCGDGGEIGEFERQGASLKQRILHVLKPVTCPARCPFPAPPGPHRG